jgi:hypothetical protein
MKTLIIYESMYGNTRDIANAIADGLSEFGDVEVLEVGHADNFVAVDVDLMVVGGPTHQFGMSRASSREQAAQQAHAPLVSPGIGIREWLDRLAPPRDQLHVATFDTMLGKPAFLKYMGRASRKFAKRLQRMNCVLVTSPESFWVQSGTGPLAEGEIDRAREWSRQLGARISQAAALKIAV